MAASSTSWTPWEYAPQRNSENETLLTSCGASQTNNSLALNRLQMMGGGFFLAKVFHFIAWGSFRMQRG